MLGGLGALRLFLVEYFHQNTPPYTPAIISLCPDIGGALRLGGTATVTSSSFLSNTATSRGLAVAVVASATMSGLSFERNELYCGAGSFRQDTDGVSKTKTKRSVRTKLRYERFRHACSRNIRQQFRFFSPSARLVLLLVRSVHLAKVFGRASWTHASGLLDQPRAAASYVKDALDGTDIKTEPFGSYRLFPCIITGNRPFQNREDPMRAWRRCAWTVLTGTTSAPVVPSKGATSRQHARRRWSTLQPMQMAPPWKRSTSLEATGAQRQKVTLSWHATMQMPAAGG